MVENPTKLLARFITGIQYPDLPDMALVHGRSSLLDASAVGLAVFI